MLLQSGNQSWYVLDLFWRILGQPVHSLQIVINQIQKICIFEKSFFNLFFYNYWSVLWLLMKFLKYPIKKDVDLC
jgi:hypothetical protein